MENVNKKTSSFVTTRAFITSGTCSTALSRVLDKAFNNPLKLEEDASALLAGGIMQHGYQCGMIWGSALSAGAQAYRLFGNDPQAETRAIISAERIVDSFRDLNKHINCLEITEIDKSSTAWQMISFFLIKGGTIGCFRMAAKYAPVALKAINSSLSEENIEVPNPPVSCSAMLAQRMGVSDLHTVMASGLAGGIGLCGGACGALGAAIWILAMKTSKEGDKIKFKDNRTQDVIDKFLDCTDYKFECSEIVGRKFENASDHAKYMQEGGCSKILDVLAAF